MITPTPTTCRLTNGRWVMAVTLDEYGPAEHLCRCEHEHEHEVWTCSVALAAAQRWGISRERWETSHNGHRAEALGRQLRALLASSALPSEAVTACPHCTPDGARVGRGCVACHGIGAAIVAPPGGAS